jgi:Domain of unknown function (DUF4145)
VALGHRRWLVIQYGRVPLRYRACHSSHIVLAQSSRAPPNKAGKCRLTLTINGVHFSVRPIKTEDGDVKRAFRLRKQPLKSDLIFDVADSVHGTICASPDFVFRRDGPGPAWLFACSGHESRRTDLNICQSISGAFMGNSPADSLRTTQDRPAVVLFNWTCPYCDHAVVVTNANYRIGTVELWLNHQTGTSEELPMNVEIIDCPNHSCRKSTLTFCINTIAYAATLSGPQGKIARGSKFERSWTLMPPAGTTIFPDYIPKPIRDDYAEARLIRELSPKASATLARRCLQGMIRDFHQVVKKRLVDEIEGIKDKVEPVVWEAIEAVREIGNIGAHMEADINVIVDVDPEEAAVLIRLIEMLIKEWYVAKHERNERLRSVKELGDAKKELRKAPPPKNG